MPRFHSVSHYHSQPSIKQSPSSNMTPLPLPHLNPRNLPLKSIPVHFQNLDCQSTPLRPSAPKQSTRSKSKSAPHSTSANSTRPKHPSKSRDDTLLATPIQSTLPPPASIETSNTKFTFKRSRKPRDGTTSPPAANSPVSDLYNLALPEFHQSSIDSPDHLINPLPTPPTLASTPKRQVLSFTDFCDQLTAEVHDQSFEANPSRGSRSSKKKPSTRRPKKGGQRRAPTCYALSDFEDVLTLDHPVFLPHGCLSRNGTPSPIKIVESPSIFNGPTLSLDDGKLASSPAATKPSSSSGSPFAWLSDSPGSLPTRHHVRAKSVASIFDLEKPQLAPKLRGAKDDWDMPPAAPPRGLTWQQKEKKDDKTASSASTSGRLAQKPPHDASRSLPSTAISSNVKEPSTRRQRAALARTSSATILSRPSVGNNQPTQSHSSRSDDESALTWQQSILRPSVKNTLLNSRSDQSVKTPEIKSRNKKNAALTGCQTPVKPACPRKAGVTSVVKSRSSVPPPSLNKRRNSLSSPRFSTAKPLENIPIPEKSRSLGLKSGENVFSEWKSFTRLASEKFADPIFSNPSPIPRAVADFNTPNRRHAKSHTHQPAFLSSSSMQSSRQTNTSAPLSSHTPESKDIKVLTPSKTRSTSEDLHLATPVTKLSSPALRAAFMYAGPQFHNCPCPAALPAPKFLFGSA